METKAKNNNLLLIGLGLVATIVFMNYNSIFKKSNSSTYQQSEKAEQSEKSIFRPGYDYFEGIWTQIADENANPLSQSQIPIRIRISKQELFYFVEVSIRNKEFEPLLGKGRYNKYGFTLRHMEFSHTTLEYKQDPKGDYLFEDGGSGYFKKIGK